MPHLWPAKEDFGYGSHYDTYGDSNRLSQAFKEKVVYFIGKEVSVVDIENLKTTLHENVIVVNFTKKDGTERRMKCTLLPKFIVEQKTEGKRTGKKPNDEVLNVWDVEQSDWRSFRIDSIIDYSFIPNEIV